MKFYKMLHCIVNVNVNIKIGDWRSLFLAHGDCVSDGATHEQQYIAILRGGDLEAPLDRGQRVGREEARPALLPATAGRRVPGAGEVREGEELDAEVSRQVDDVPAPGPRPRPRHARAGLSLGSWPRAGRAEQPRHQHAHLQYNIFYQNCKKPGHRVIYIVLCVTPAGEISIINLNIPEHHTSNTAIQSSFADSSTKQ